MDRAYFNEQKLRVDESILNIASNMVSNTYPKPPEQRVKYFREMNPIDYTKLLHDGLVPYRPHEEFKILKSINLGGIGVCDYFGQVTRDHEKPDGVGLVVSEYGSILEGAFKNGDK